MSTCREVRDLAPELALGSVSGAERADALDHVATCLGCRRYVDELASVADSVLVLAPEADPPAGFESRVLSLVQAKRRRSLRWLAVAAVVALLAAGATWMGASSAYRADRTTRAAFELLGGSELRAARLRARSGAIAGHAVAYDGKPSWVMVSVESSGEASSYGLVLVLDDNTSVELSGVVGVDARGGSWGGTIPVRASRLKEIRLVDGTGTVEFTAPFSP